ncbi:MAG: UvrD-helicase domain-containing protein [Sedimentibacter sp.]|uniref:UvrD-helicase domain-containing protein n=1 Tax=Sedimentibacter sp. TaxID=1960295 RepID=UPI0029826265|nr:UvrD-helicase domain-containing protein [Sedimentibacter sp.]MDW5300710.1 UvrD-helicase domain-containing protein [Sedimentibacter sp.]
MALINCPECNKQISDKAEACPHCGLPASYFNASNFQDNNSNVQDNSYLAELDYKNLNNVLISYDNDYSSIFSSSHYITSHELNHFNEIYSSYYKALSNPLIMQYLTNNAASLRIDVTLAKRFIISFAKLAYDIELHNKQYVDKKLIEYKYYFDNILKNIDPNIMLDEEQRRAVIIDDNHCLLVAGAGAGKTTTMAAKVKYLVEKQGVNPEEIIVISYTNKAIDELKERINKGLKIKAKICTFHSFAFEIVKQFTSEPPEVNFSSFKIVFEMLEKAIFNDKHLMRNLVLFMGYYFDLTEDVFKFDNLEQYHLMKSAQDYETLKSGLGEYIKRIENQRAKQVKTITGEYLRSVQEVQIANFLYLNNIDYEYEKVYPYEIVGSKKKYTPDFYIWQGENSAYLEHYGITESYYSNIFTPAQLKKYKKSIYDKRNIHRDFKTNLIETWSIYNDGNSLLDHLKEVLESNGFVLKPRNLDEVYKKIVETGKDKYIVRLVLFMIKFIEHYKTNGYSDGGFDILRKKTDNSRSQLFLDIAESVYNYYQEKLKEKNQIDFADMINDSNYYLSQIEKVGLELPYKYIIIDEFQDVARQRFNLTKRLSEITKAKVVAVGDDWQSIYAFAGSDISLFTRFLDLMGSGTELKITHTYRNSQELIDIAGGFVQKNSQQIRKKLISPKHLPNPIELVAFDDSNKPMVALANVIVDTIGKIIDEYGEKSSIVLIGRYNFDMYKLYYTKIFQELPNGKVRCVKYPKANITFMTAHGSKGLGYDNVIIINMFETKFGFPCQVEDDPIIKLVIHEDKSMPFAEERRLFYVALTRTKNKVFIATPIHGPSRFLIELIRDFNILHPSDLNKNRVDLFKLRCPVCGFPLKYEFNKNYGLGLYICTNESEICDFMTNSKFEMKDIIKCDKCEDGYLIVKKRLKDSKYFYGCTNYGVKDRMCKNSRSINN